MVFLAFSYEYFLHRITQTDSLSTIQRFGFLLALGIDDLLIGVKDVSMLGDVGIHNGVFLYYCNIQHRWNTIYFLSVLLSLHIIRSHKVVHVLGLIAVGHHDAKRWCLQSISSSIIFINSFAFGMCVQSLFNATLPMHQQSPLWVTSTGSIGLKVSSTKPQYLV
jgi:hypothetical protein